MKRLMLLLPLLLPIAGWGQDAMSVESVALAQSRVQQALGKDQDPKWTISILDEYDWKDFQRRVVHQKVNTNTAFTDIDHRVTYVRGSYVLSASLERLRHTMLHEKGHLECGCQIEAMAEHFALTASDKSP